MWSWLVELGKENKKNAKETCRKYFGFPKPKIRPVPSIKKRGAKPTECIFSLTDTEIDRLIKGLKEDVKK